MIHSIYRVTNRVNLKTYVGYTSKDPRHRFREHCKASGKSLISKAIQKYGVENFDFDVIFQSLDRDYTLFTMEEWFIREFNSHAKDGHGYNLSYGGTSNIRGIKFSDETRANMSRAQTGLKRNSGPAISAALKGRIITPEARAKIRAANLWKKASEETKAKMRKPKNFTPEQRAAMAERAKLLAATRKKASGAKASCGLGFLQPRG